MQFSFDFSLRAPTSIRFGDTNPNTGFRFIPKNAYDLGDLSSSK